MNARETLKQVGQNNGWVVDDGQGSGLNSILFTKGNNTVMVAYVANGRRISWADAETDGCGRWSAFRNNGISSMIARENVRQQVINVLEGREN